MRRVVITGIGVISPAGVGREPLWRQVNSGKACTRRIDRFDASRYQCQVAGHADDFNAAEAIPPRLLKKTDRFTHLALASVSQALVDAGIVIGENVAPDRIDVMVGNVLGGWEFAERELRNLWREGVRAVSPYQATAWFPTAPQGNICILHGIKGRSRTFVADRASGAYALIHGAESIQRGHADVALAGGTEAPLSPYGWLCCQTSGLLMRGYNDRPDQAYRPYDRGHRGSIIAEGSAFLVLEELEHAQQRGARIHGELSGWATSTDGYTPYYTCEPNGRVLARTIKKSLQRSNLQPADLGVVYAHGSAIPVEDTTDLEALKLAMGEHAYRVPVTTPRSAIGHMLGAATSADVILALHTLEHGQIPPTTNLEQPAFGFDLDMVRGEPRSAPSCKHCLVISRGLGGVNTCLLVSR